MRQAGRQLRLIGMLVRMKLSRMMVFRFSFFSAFFVDSTMFLFELLAFSAIYANVDSIGGWSRAEMTVFIGTFSLINALNMVVYFFGVIQIPDKIIRGGLDQYLTGPMNPLLRLTFESVNPGSLPLVAVSLAIIAYGAAQLPVAPTVGQACLYGLMVLLMTLLWYDLEVLLRCIPFFVQSSYSVADRIEGSMLSMNFRIPGTLYRGVLKLLFYFFLPYGIMSTLPTQLLAGTLTPAGFLYGVLMVALFTWLTLFVWRKGLSRYKSASS